MPVIMMMMMIMTGLVCVSTPRGGFYGATFSSFKGTYTGLWVGSTAVGHFGGDTFNLG